MADNSGQPKDVCHCVWMGVDSSWDLIITLLVPPAPHPLTPPQINPTQFRLRGEIWPSMTSTWLELTHNSGVWVNVSKGSGLDQPAPVCHSMLMAGPDQWPAVSQKNNSTTEPVDRQTDRRWPLTEPELSPALLIKQTLVWSDYLPRWVYSLQWEVGAH